MTQHCGKLYFFIYKGFYKDNYKIEQNYFNSITKFQFFPLWNSWGPGSRDAQTQIK